MVTTALSRRSGRDGSHTSRAVDWPPRGWVDAGQRLAAAVNWIVASTDCAQSSSTTYGANHQWSKTRWDSVDRAAAQFGAASAAADELAEAAIARLSTPGRRDQHQRLAV
jgi:hypothetical protein